MQGSQNDDLSGKTKTDLLVAVGEVKQVLHCHKGVAKSFHGGNSLFCINQQHLLQQAHKLSTICLLSQQVTTFHIHHQVHLEDVFLSALLVNITISVVIKQQHSSFEKDCSELL